MFHFIGTRKRHESLDFCIHFKMNCVFCFLLILIFKKQSHRYHFGFISSIVKMFTRFTDIHSLMIDKIEREESENSKKYSKLNWILIRQKNYWCCDLLTFSNFFRRKMEEKQNTRPILCGFCLFGKWTKCAPHAAAYKRLFDVTEVERASGRAGGWMVDRLSRTNNNRKWYVPIFACTKQSHHPANFAWT